MTAGLLKQEVIINGLYIISSQGFADDANKTRLMKEELVSNAVLIRFWHRSVHRAAVNEMRRL